MDTLSAHFVPLLFIPCVALLILSTSNRLVNLNNRILHMKDSAYLLACKRVNLFRRALISFYISVSFFALATLINCFVAQNAGNDTIVRFVLLLGALALYAGILIMIIESWVAIKKSNKNLRN